MVHPLKNILAPKILGSQGVWIPPRRNRVEAGFAAMIFWDNLTHTKHRLNIKRQYLFVLLDIHVYNLKEDASFCCHSLLTIRTETNSLYMYMYMFKKKYNIYSRYDEKSQFL